MSTPLTCNFENLSAANVDLHSHTTYSDGKLTPQELIERAVNFQVNMLAITDHDTVQGVNVAKQYLAEKKYPLTLIEGVEISTSWHGFDIHVVGLNIDTNHYALIDLLSSQQQVRQDRAQTIGEKLAKSGIENCYQHAQALAKDDNVTRAHFAHVLVNLGVVDQPQKAFDKYLGKGKRAFVKPQWCTIKDAVRAIHASGGVAVLAHPVRYDLSGKWLRKLIVEFKEAGGNGLEIVLPQMNLQQKQQMLSYCLEYDLHASMGSDFHFPSKWNDLGRHLRLPDNSVPIWQLFSFI